MPQDLLALPDYEPPMGDLFNHPRLETGQAIWTKPLPGERAVPKKRIIPDWHIHSWAKKDEHR